MSLRTIQCENCGSNYETRNKNTKYCRVCRLHRNIMFLRGATATCKVCGERYSPTERGQFSCATCASLSDSGHRGDCAVCKREDVVLLRGPLALCVECVDDPEKRPLIIKGLAKRIKQNLDESAKV